MPTLAYTPDNTPPVAIVVAFTPSNTAPVAKTVAFSASNGAPVAKAVAFTPDNTAATAKTVAFTRDNTPPGAHALAAPGFSNTPAAPIGLDGVPVPLPPMPAKFSPAFADLAALQALTASAADIGTVLQGFIGGQFRSYQVRAGADAEDAPGIVRPANFDAEDNPVVFVQS